MAASNTLLSIRMILAKAMVMVERATQDDARPFDVIAEHELPLASLTLSIDQFSDEVLRPALDAAVANKQPKGAVRPFQEAAPDDDDVATLGLEDHGMFGRIIRFYDPSTDTPLCRVEILARPVSAETADASS